MFGYRPDTESYPDEVKSIEEAKAFIEREERRIIAQVNPLATKLEMNLLSKASKK